MDYSSLNFGAKTRYLKYGKRSDVHSKIREDLYTNLQIECLKLKQPITKAFDVMIKMILEDEKLLAEFKNKIKSY